MARKGYRSKLKLKSRQKRASVDEADGTIIECAVCAKKIVIGGRLQKRRILWDGVETHACNACGISWGTFKAAKEKSDRREPTSQEWAAWEATRPQYPRIAISPSPEPLPTVYEAAAILCSFRNPLGSSASSSTPTASSSSSSYPRSTEPPPPYFESRYPSLSSKSNEANEVTLKVDSTVPFWQSRPASLYVDIEPTVDEFDALSDPGYTNSTGSLYSPEIPITPLLVSFFAPVISSAPRRNDSKNGESAYPQW